MAFTARTTPFKTASLFGAVILAALLGSVTLSTWARDGQGHHREHGGPGSGLPMMHGHMFERMLDGIDTSPEQRAQIKEIRERAQADLQAQREAGRGLREQGLKLFAQPVVDAQAAEALRQQMLQQHDQASRRMLQAMLEISRVLTPAQRQQLAQKMAERKARHQQGHRGEHDTAPQQRPAPR
jgi:periplasmic protein CpxP/Spy